MYDLDHAEGPATAVADTGHTPAWPINPAYILERVSDEIDYGVIVVTRESRLVYSNVVGRQAIDAGRVMRLERGLLQAVGDEQQLRWLAGLRDACRGLRGLVFLGTPDRATAVSVCPIERRDAGSPLVLAIMGKQSSVESLSILAYGREKGLTAAELHVLERLAQERAPAQIAREEGRSEATVRSQIRSLLEKTQADCIRSLLIKMSRLPPVRPRNLSRHPA